MQANYEQSKKRMRKRNKQVKMQVITKKQVSMHDNYEQSKEHMKKRNKPVNMQVITEK